MASIRAFAAKVLEQEQRIDIVVLNAAIRGCPMVRHLPLLPSRTRTCKGDTAAALVVRAC
jgi:NAD(P)-dependent dehydrogenase (short-subunit alcohol dehydrogenase family)